MLYTCYNTTALTRIQISIEQRTLWFLIKENISIKIQEIFSYTSVFG